MPRYEVIVTRDTTESAVVTVIARNETEAEALAREEAEFNVDIEWSLDDGNFYQPYTNGAELIQEPEYKNRADLTSRPAWRDLETDSSGNPLVWMNYYEDASGHHWESPWSCQCDEDDVSPYESEWIGPFDAAEITLWQSLEDA